MDGRVFCGLHRHHSDSPIVIDLAAYSCPTIDLILYVLPGRWITSNAYSPGEEWAHVAITEVGKQVTIFQKELTFLRIENFKPIQIRDLLIYLYL